MKAWFAKIRISAALDGGRRPAAWSRRETDLSDELRGFEQEMTELDHALKQTAPQPHAPPSLHGSIMRAVRAVERPAANARRELAFLRWLPVPVAALLALMVVWHAARGPARLPVQDAQPLAVATTALQVSGEMARAVPSAVVSPLADELKKLNLDLDNTAQFLLSSLP
jgi:hypothetical protein